MDEAVERRREELRAAAEKAHEAMEAAEADWLGARWDLDKFNREYPKR